MTIRPPTLLERHLAVLILRGDCFTSDDLTADGQVNLDPDHTPNGKQNGVGAVFNQARRRALIATDGRVVPSRNPHRKGGAIRIWCPTDAGRLWAKTILR